MTTQEEITQLETALAALPIGITSTKDAAGNQVNYDRAVVEKRLDVLRARLAAEESGQRIGISRLVAGGPNDG